MRVTYDSNEDKLRILFSNAPIFDTHSECADLTVDRDQHGRVVGLELATASKHVTDPHTIDSSGKNGWRDDEGEKTVSVILVGDGI
jgi:uncharacterized protein YuzE